MLHVFRKQIISTTNPVALRYLNAVNPCDCTEVCESAKVDDPKFHNWLLTESDETFSDCLSYELGAASGKNMKKWNEETLRGYQRRFPEGSTEDMLFETVLMDREMDRSLERKFTWKVMLFFAGFVWPPFWVFGYWTGSDETSRRSDRMISVYLKKRE